MKATIKFGFIICFWLTTFSLGAGIPACLWDQWMRAAFPFMLRLTMILGAIGFVIAAAQIWNRKKVRFWRYFLGFGYVYLVFMNYYIPKNPIPNPPYFSILDRPDNPGPHFLLRWQLQYPCWDSTHNYKLYLMQIQLCPVAQTLDLKRKFTPLSPHNCLFAQFISTLNSDLSSEGHTSEDQPSPNSVFTGLNQVSLLYVLEQLLLLCVYVYSNILIVRLYNNFLF